MKIRQIVLMILSVAANQCVWAELVEFLPPTPIAIVMSVRNVTIDVTDQLNNDTNPTIGESIPRFPAPQVSFSPGTSTINWRIRCTEPAEVITSPKGELFYNNRRIAVVATSLLKNPDGPGYCGNTIETLTENFVLPQQAVIDAILRDVFDQTFAQVLGTRIIRGSAVLEYRRTFNGNVPFPTSVSGSVIFNINGTLDAQIDGARLVRVNARVSGNPTIALARGGMTNVSATWLADIEIIGRGAPITVRSDRLEFRTPSGQVIESRALPLTKRTPAALVARRINTETFTESIRVDAGMAQRARQMGAGSILAVRAFTDGRNTFNATIPIALGGGAAGDFLITRQELSFNTGEQIKVVRPGELLFAFLDLNYTGLGTVRGRWELARLTSGGVPLFYPLPPVYGPDPSTLATVQKQCSERSARRTKTLVTESLIKQQLTSFCSPILPTSEAGSYVLRFRLDSPQAAFPEPVVRFDVLASAAPGLPAVNTPAVAELRITLPAPGAELGRDTRFAWQQGPEVKVYRIEFYTDEQAFGAPVTGLYARGDQNAISISGLVLSHLAPGSTYWWQIVGINSQGAVAARSKPRKALMP